jgi:hypothetical protein
VFSLFGAQKNVGRVWGGGYGTDQRSPSNLKLLFIHRNYHDLPARRGQCFVCENSADFVHLAGITRTTALRDAAHPITSLDMWEGLLGDLQLYHFFYKRIWNHEDCDLMVRDAVKFGT